MTKPLNVQVVPEELMARAAELESVVAVPAVNPATPCALPMITTAAASLAFSGNAMQTYLDAGNKARRQLADALRQAAKAYTGTDEQAAQALNGEGGGVSGMRRAGATASEAPAGRRLGDYAPGTGPGPDPCGPGPVVPPGGATPPPYYPVRQAAEEIAAPDQGAAFSAFAQAWTAVQQPLLDSTNAFRPFQNWQGTAASAVEANFEQYRQWVYSMVKMCQQLVTQAQGVTTAHSWAITQHPTVAQLDKLDADWNRLEAYKLALPKMFFAFEWQRQQAENEVRLEEKSFLKAYAKLQSQSESVLAEYYKKANLPLTALDPQAPPAAYSPPPPAPAPIAPNPGPSPSPAPT
ncbi:PPE domain-containing protein, partial [Mycobacterium basiliense]